MTKEFIPFAQREAMKKSFKKRLEYTEELMRKSNFKHTHALRDFSFVIKTDASVKGRGAAHNFCIRPVTVKVNPNGTSRGVRGKEICTRSFKSLYEDNNHAELYSIEKALMKCDEKGFKNILIRTDSQNVVHYLYGKLGQGAKEYLENNTSLKRDLDTVKRLLEKVNGVIEFNPREFNLGANEACNRKWIDTSMSMNLSLKKGKPRVVNFKHKKRSVR